jgi:hypothetical protein
LTAMRMSNDVGGRTFGLIIAGCKIRGETVRSGFKAEGSAVV